MSVTALFFLLFFSLSEVASTSHDGFIVTRYSMTDGLPLNSTNIVRQGPDRNLWLATYNGLLRFDGNRFTLFDTAIYPELRSNRITDMFLSKNFPGLWLMLESGGIVHYDYNEFRFFGREDGFTDRWVVVFYDLPDGRMVIGSNDGAYIYDGVGFKKMYDTPARDFYRVNDFIFNENEVWLASSAGLIHYDLKSDHARRIPFYDESVSITSIEWHPDGSPIMTSTSGVLKFTGNRLIHDPKYAHIQTPAFPTLYTHDNRIYTSGRNGVFVEIDGVVHEMTGDLDPTDTFLLTMLRTRQGRILAQFSAGEFVEFVGTHIVRTDKINGIDQYEAHRIYEDDEENVWVTLRNGGLIKLTRNPFRYIGAEIGMTSDNLLAVFKDSRNRTWIGVRNYGTYILENGTIRHLSSERVYTPIIVNAISEDKHGNVWLGSYETGIFKVAPDGDITQISLGFIGGHDSIFSMYYHEDRDLLLIGTADGLIMFNDMNGFRKDFNTSDGLPHHIIRHITSDNTGRIWVATQGNGIAVFDEESQRFSAPFNQYGLENKGVRSMYLDTELDGVWVGTESFGLYYFSDDFNGKLDTRNGLPDNVIHSISDTKDGFLWMHTNRGIFFSSKEDLIRAMQNDAVVRDIAILDTESGMRNAEGNGGVQPSVFQDQDGWLWYSTQQGLAGINPYDFNRGTDSMTLYIDRIDTQSGRWQRPAESLTLPRGDRDLILHFSGLYFTAPKRIRYQYRFVGYYDQWINVQPGVHQITFPNLPHGSYTFELRARDPAGIVMENSTSLRLTIPAMWYESYGFYASILVLIGVMIYLIIMYNLRKEYKIQEKLRQLVDERTRQYQDEKQAVIERNAIIESQKQELLKINKAKDNFIYLLGHDLRSPLQSMLGTTSILETDFDQLTKEDRHELLRVTRISFDRLNTLISNLLDWAQMDAGLVRLDIKTINLNALCRQILDVHAQSMKNKGIQGFLQIKGEIEIISDPNLLQLALRNLISNAIKFTGSGGKITLSATRSDKLTTIIVSDTGVGMDETQINNLFEIGSISTTRGTANEKGTGIGLLLVWEVIRLLNAELSIDSSAEKGTTFTIKIPDAH